MLSIIFSLALSIRHRSRYEIAHACMLTIMISGRWNGPLGRTSVRISPLLRTKLCQIELNYDSEVSSSSFLRSHLPRHSWFKEICLYVNTSIYFASFRIERFLVWKGYIYFLHILLCQVRNYLRDCISSVLFAFGARYDEVNQPTQLIIYILFIIQGRGAQT